MNILELDSFNLSDAVKFNDKLNPRIWQGHQMRPEVRAKLLEIAADFKEFLGLSDLDVKDITVSGSNAAYTYTPHSDIDLHLVVDIPRADQDEVYRELFDAKKYEYNDTHNIKIGDYDVELYVENANQPPVSKGVFSVMNNDWISIPRQRRATVDDDSVRSKYEDIKHRIEDAVTSQDSERIKSLARKIKSYRQAGLARNGELGSENLAYKMLRNQGYIKKLYDALAAARDAELSLTERKKKKKKKVRYGFGGYWYPGFSFGTGSDAGSDGGGGDGGGEARIQEVGLSPDGVSPETKMFLSEKPTPTHEEIIRDFFQWAIQQLGVEKVPGLKLKKDPQWSIRNQSFGRYDNNTGNIDLAVGNRHIMDVLRTLAHELQHRKQDERETMPPNAGETGSPYENEAHVVAGILMRNYADLHPEYFEDVPVSESASGYIPTAREKNDPRYKMALTVDIKPGEVGRQANKMGLKTDSQGRPALLMKTANLREAAKPKSHGYGSTPMSQVPGEQEDDLGNQEATGPEFPPRMPAGTTKIDVDDLTDWYRLGMDISDLDDADPKNYGKGPPQTVVVFPSDEAEQGYLKQFKRLGLKTHDIDPDVAGGEDIYGKHLARAKEEDDLAESLRKELQQFKEQDLFEIKMSPSNLRQEAAKTGAQAGMEFEMIVPNLAGETEPEYEPDYDQDQRSRSFDDIRDFFHDGDYNSRRDVDRLIEKMGEEFAEWQDEQIMNSWDEEGFELLKEYIKDNGYFDDDEAQEEATNALQAEYGDDITPEDFEKMLEAIVSEKFDEFVQDQWDNQGQFYDEAREQYIDDQRGENDESDWLDEHYPYMTDVQNNFDISWPYYTNINDSDGEITKDDLNVLADDFSDAVGMPVNASLSYHGGRREPGTYVIEPDGSLEPDDSDDYGLEFVSPPMPIDQMIDQLNKVREWAGRNGCYTNKSTGLHINISVPNYNLRELDYVKLALLLGDEYVLKQYGRSSNTYAKSAISKVKDKVRQYPDAAKALMDKMREHMEDLATKAIHSGTTDKYTSINTKSGYIEFRSPGGDWLGENFDKIETTLLRFTVALSAAMDPQAYREEYLKKLYRLLEPVAVEQNKDTIKYFADYVAGKTPKAALRSFVRQAQLERKVKRGETGGEQMWWRVSNPQHSYGEIEVVANSKQEAIAKALGPDGYPSWANTRQSIQAVPIRPFDTSAVKATVGEPQAIGRQSGPTLNGRPSNPDGGWVISPENDRSRVVYRFAAASFDDANIVRRQWAADNEGVWIVQRDMNRTLGQPQSASRTPATTGVTQAPQTPDQQDGGLIDVPIEIPDTAPRTSTAPGQPQQQFTGYWLITDPEGNVIHRFGGIGNAQSDANRVAMDWLRRNPRHMQHGVGIGPEMA